MTNTIKPRKLLNTGVYAIFCVVNEKVYVGSTTIAFNSRWVTHHSQLRRGKHPNRHLSSAWDKYGEGAFLFIILERCKPSDCVLREQFWIDNTNAADRRTGYNARPLAENNRGFRQSEEAKEKVAAHSRGRKHTAETKEIMSAIAKRRGINEQQREKLNAAKRDRGRVPLSDDHKAKLSAKMKGRRLAPEHVAKMKATLKGRVHGPEVRARMSEGQIGKKHSEATKEKMSLTRKGRKHSDAHRRAISEGLRKAKATREVLNAQA